MLLAQLKEDMIKKYINDTVYIVGTGPTLRLFPTEFLNQYYTIGLNEAYKHYKCDVNLTIHPELIPLYPKRIGDWVTKEKGEFKKDVCINGSVYWFENNKDVKDFEYIKPEYKNKLYVGRGIHTGAMCLAAKLGFKYAIMVGCDMGHFGANQHHAHDAPVQFHGLPANIVYNEYYFNAAILRKKLRELYGIEFLSLSPCLAPEIHGKVDFYELASEKRSTHLPNPKDISTYNRDKPDFPTS